MANMPGTMLMEYKLGINAPLVRREAKTLMVEGDRCANTIVIEVTDGLEPADLTGCSVCAYMIRADGNKPFVEGTVEGNVVTVCLGESFYAVPGGYNLFVRLTHTDGTKRTLLWLNGWINDEGQGDVIDTENVVPDLDDLLAQIEAMETATTNANTAATTANTAAETANTAADQAVAIATMKGDVALDNVDIAVMRQDAVIEQFTTDMTAALLTKAPAIECEASGSLVTVTDAAAQSAVQLVTHIEPVQEGEGDPSPDNVRPISGWSSVTAQRVRGNLFKPFGNNVTLNGITCSAGKDGLFTLHGTATKGFAFTQTPDIPLPAGTYTLTVIKSASATFSVYCKTSSGTTVGSTNSRRTFSAGEPITLLGLWIDSGTTFDNLAIYAQLEPGETATTYTPYQGQTLTAALPETVYGGAVDWGTGALTVTHGYAESYAGESVPDGWISSTGDLTEGAQIVYPLADPYTIQLTPQQLDLLKGTNNLWSDTGDTDLVYVADTKLYIDGKFDELQAAILSQGSDV